MNEMLSGAAIALTMLIVTAQLPQKAIWSRYIWLFDLGTFIGLIYMTTIISSTHVFLATVYGGIIYSALLHTFNWLFWSRTSTA